ncbi:MAG TPA: molybdenum cofactor biosynthesis protein MoaE [Polyangiaceae bacterium]
MTAQANATGLFEVRATPLDPSEAIRAVSGPSVGGIATFVGTVRDQNQGQRVTLLDYEAYQGMAEKQMRQVAEQIQREIPGVALAALHRVGRLEVGDIAVVCAASSAHRGEALAACQLLIDRIKTEVPIWKREHGPDGPYWVGWEDARTGGHGSPDGGVGP